MWTGFITFRMGFSGGSYEHGNEHLDTKKGREFTELLSDYQHLKKDFIPWN
jgi:hypothetical protein